MISLRRTQVLLLSASAITLAAGGAYAFFFTITKNKVNQSNVIAKDTKDFEIGQEKLWLTLNSIKDRDAEIKKLDSYFIKEREIVAFTRQVELLGTTSKTAITFESLTPAIGEKKVPTLDFRIKVTGEFSGVLHALELIENLPAKINVSSVRLTRSDKGTFNAPPPTTPTPLSSPKTKPGPVVVPKIVLPKWRLDISGTALNFIREK